MLKKHTAF
jgi:hypothetical protein